MSVPEIARDRPPKVFISYCQESLQHRARVADFAARLRGDGVDAVIDQYVLAPPEGFPRWIEDEIESADFVLMVCTEAYYSRVRGQAAPAKDKGVLWESSIIYQHVYDAGARNTKFIPVLFEGGKRGHIPRPLRQFAYVRVDTAEGYEQLYRRLSGQPKTIVPPLGKLRKLARRPLNLR